MTPPTKTTTACMVVLLGGEGALVDELETPVLLVEAEFVVVPGVVAGTFRNPPVWSGEEQVAALEVMLGLGD